MLFLQISRVLEALVNSTDDAGWESTVTYWLVAAIVVSATVAGGMLLLKWFRKKAARNIQEKTWDLRRTVIFVLAGLAPTLVVLPVIWYWDRNFHNYVSVGGLLTGIAFSWLCYLVLIASGHLLSPGWRRDIF